MDDAIREMSACNGKEAFADAATAHKAKRRIAMQAKKATSTHAKRRPIETYRCPHCGYWHLGTIGKSKHAKG